MTTLRALLGRRIGADDRRRLALLAGGLLVGVLVVLSLLGGGRDRERAATAAPPPPSATPTATVDPAEVPVPSEEGGDGPPPSAIELERGRRAARIFLRSYLRYSYGKADAAMLPNATDSLREELGENRPRVPAADRKPRPRIELLQVDGAGDGRIALIAMIENRGRRHSLRLELARYATEWLVTAVES